MIVRGVSVEGSGRIVRTISARPAKLGLNVGVGETLFQITDDDGSFVDDAHLVVSETGAFTPTPDAPEGVVTPGGELQLVPL